ncbi:hypothetical protein [Oligoflexus tunisiensis]|uniref:hypothetical protein n=1 Tax=Oligoflexus tunisiensis TaxID=708132 RepID=UPI00114CA517|nr:hypothetical protein [Oligoflexus tunisiensis]
MKLILTVAMMTFASSPSFSADLSKANLYDCQGRNTQVSFSTSSLTGEPQLHLSGSPFAGQKLTATELEETRMGYQASVSVANIYDASIDYTLIVPVVMTTRGQTFQVNGVLIKTSAGGLISPESIPGPVQQNTLTALRCRATLVDF